MNTATQGSFQWENFFENKQVVSLHNPTWLEKSWAPIYLAIVDKYHTHGSFQWADFLKNEQAMFLQNPKWLDREWTPQVC